MKNNKNKTIFTFLLVFTLLFSFTFVSAWGDTGFTIYSDDVTNTGAFSTDLESVISWDTDYPDIKVAFQYRLTGSSTWNTATDTEKWINAWDSGFGNFEDTINGLYSNTEYEVRVLGTEYCDDSQNCYSSDLTSLPTTFTTDYNYPYVEDTLVDDIGQNSAEFNSQVFDIGSAPSLEAYFEYRKAGDSYTSTKSTGEYTKTVDSDYTSFEYTKTDLDIGSDYEIRGCVYDSANDITECGDSTLFQTESLTKPSVSTLSATEITQASGKIRGELNSLGDYSQVDIKFYSNKTGIMAGIPESEITFGIADTYSYDLESLGFDSQYKYALAYYDTETSSWELASEKTFTTLSFEDLNINTDEATNITSLSAELNGYIGLGDYDNATVSFSYKKGEIGEWIDTSNQIITTSGDYNTEITGLDNTTTYYYKAQATGKCDSTGCYSILKEGSNVSFTTTSEATPTIKTLNTTDITHNSTVFNSELIQIDENTIDIFWEYRKYTETEWESTTKSQVNNPEANDKFTKEINDLNSNIGYEVRAGVYSYEFDTNFYGSIKTFITRSPPWKNTQKKTITSGEEFEEFVNDLNPNTEYEFRAIMENGNNSYYGDSETFTTQSIKPQIINDIEKINLGYNDNKEIDIKENYDYQNSYIFSIEENNIYSDTNLTNEEGDNVLGINLEGDIIKLKSYKAIKDYDSEITLINSEGETVDSFKIIIEPSSFQKIIEKITGVFPDSEDLSTGQKIGYVLISMLVVTIILVAIGVTTGGLSKGILILTGVLDFLLLIFYTSIGYISVGILITLILVAIALAYFKIRGGTS